MNSGDAIREFAGECGIEFSDDNTAVVDHLNYDANDDGQVTIEFSHVYEENNCLYLAYINCRIS